MELGERIAKLEAEMTAVQADIGDIKEAAKAHAAASAETAKAVTDIASCMRTNQAVRDSERQQAERERSKYHRKMTVVIGATGVLVAAVNVLSKYLGF